MARKRIDPFEKHQQAMGAQPTEESADKGSAAPTEGANRRQTPTEEAERRQTPTDADRELVRLTARVAAWQKRELEAKARSEGRLLSELVREAVRDYLKGTR